MSVFRQIIDGTQIEDAVTATLKTWFPTYLHEMGLQVGGEPLQSPQSWGVRPDDGKLSADQLPALIVVSPGTDGSPVASGDGDFDAPFRVGVALFAGAKDVNSVNRAVRIYAASIRAILLQKPGLDGLTRSVAWVSESFDEGPSDQIRTLGACAVEFNYIISAAVNKYGGPDSPIVPAEPDLPIVEHEFLEMTTLGG